MSKKNHHPITQYEQFIANNAEMINHFIQTSAGGSSLSILEPEEAFLKGELKDHQYSHLVEYTKVTLKTYPFSDEAHHSFTESISQSDLADLDENISASSYQPMEESKEVSSVPTLSIINKDGRYETLVLTTTPEKAKEIWQAYGFDSHLLVDPITRIVAKIGNYKKTIFARNLERDGLVSAKDFAKSQIVSIAQASIGALHPLYECINTYTEFVSSPLAHLQEVYDKLEDYHRVLNNIFLSIDLSVESSRFHAGSQTLKEGIANAMGAIVNYKLQIKSLLDKKEALTAQEVESLLKAYGWPNQQPQPLIHFIQDQINAFLTTAFSANYDISWLFRGGSLASDILAAKFIAEEMTAERVDYHNPATAEHAFNFAAKARASTNGLVTIDFKKHGFHPHDEVELARQIALIDAVQTGMPFAGKVQEGIFGINWSFSIIELIKVPFVIIANFVVDIVGFVCDIFYEMGVYLAKKWFRQRSPVNPLAEQKIIYPSEWMAKKLGINVYTAVYKNYEVTSKIFNANPITHMPKHSLVKNIVWFVGRQLNKLTKEPFVEFWKEFLQNMKSVKRVFFDFYIGMSYISAEQIGEVLDKCIDQQAKAAERNNDACLEHVCSYKNFNREKAKELQTYSAWKASLAVNGVVEALSPYSLTPDEPNDILSGVSDVARMIFEIPTQKIYREHPIGGVGFSYAASIAALPMLFSSAPKFGFIEYWTDNVTLPIAKLFVGHTEGLGATITTSLIEAKGFFLLIDTLNGREALLPNAAKAVLEKPVISTLVCGAAIGIGNLIAFGINIPGLSAWLANHAGGDFPYRELELGIGGFKVATGAAALVIDLSHDLNTAIDHSVDAQRHLFRQQIEMIYLAEKNLAKEDLEKDFDRYHATAINERTENYCKQLKVIFKNSSQYAELITHLAQTLRIQPELKPLTLRSLANDLFGDQAKHVVDRMMIRSKIEQLDPAQMSNEEKYQVMHYVRCHYSDAPAYMAAVCNKLYPHKKTGPLATSIRHILYYLIPVAFSRALIALCMQGYFHVTHHPERAKAVAQIWKDFGRQLLTDIGLVVKAISKVIHAVFRVFGAVVVIPLFMVFSPLVLLAYPLINQDPERVLFSLVKDIYMGFNKFFFDPGYCSRVVEAIVGRLRQFAQSKNLHLATINMMLYDEKRAFTQLAIHPDIGISDQQKDQNVQSMPQSLKGSSSCLLASLLGTSVLSESKAQDEFKSINDSDESKGFNHAPLQQQMKSGDSDGPRQSETVKRSENRISTRLIS